MSDNCRYNSPRSDMPVLIDTISGSDLTAYYKCVFILTTLHPSVLVSSPVTINTVSYFPLTHIIVIISAVMGCRFSNMQPIFVSENTNKYIFFSPGELPGLGLIQIYDSTLFQPGLGRPSIVIKYNLTHQIQWERKVLRPVHKT